MRKKISHVSVWAPLLDGWLLKLEKKAFGWYYWSETTEDEKGLERDSEGNYHVTHKYTRWLQFRRPSPYTRNPLFKLAEFFGDIFSFCRRLFVSFGFFALIIVVIFAGIFHSTSSNDLEGICNIIATILLGIYTICLIGSVACCLLGAVFRKLFRIDDKLRAIFGDDLEDACAHMVQR